MTRVTQTFTTAQQPPLLGQVVLFYPERGALEAA